MKDGAKVAELTLGNHKAAGVLAELPGKTDHLPCKLQYFPQMRVFPI
jgi:hypothetical protein